MLIAIIAISCLALGFGLLLGFSAIRFHVEEDPIAEKINELLPQSQCGQCGFPGCGPYAEAIANGTAEINTCPPGGESTMISIAQIMGIDPVPMGAEGEESALPTVALIIEKDCIGCTVCIKACPVDAIIGSTRLMHTVIIDECTGCQACVEPCPVDCIEMKPTDVTIRNWTWPTPNKDVPGEIAMPEPRQAAG
jgi:H+/Na+-translocating ferredoxin:NAD+ oxidoreductase subunit B